MADVLELEVLLLPQNDAVFGPAEVERSLQISELKSRFLPDKEKKLLHPESFEEYKDEMTLVGVTNQLLAFIQKTPVESVVPESIESDAPRRLMSWEVRVKETISKGDLLTAKKEGVETVYEVMEKLGEGGQAAVWSCRNVSTKDEYAAKAFNQSSLGSATDASSKRTALNREVQTLLDLSHPRIVNIIDEFETEFHYFYVMDWAKEGNLLEAVMMHDHGALNEQEARYIFWQLLDAVSFMHSKDIIHRDLKLENVLIESTSCSADRDYYCVKVADFGLAKKLTIQAAVSSSLANGMPAPLERAISKVGTPAYCAPEVKLLSTETIGYGKGVDYWSLGVCLYTMVTGRHPFGSGGCGLCEATAANAESLMAGAFTKDLPQWEALSPALKDLIGGLLHIDPASRYGLEECLCHEWITQHKVQRVSFPMPVEPEEEATHKKSLESRAKKQSKLNSQLVFTCRDVLGLDELWGLQVSIESSLDDVFNHSEHADVTRREKTRAIWEDTRKEIDVSAVVFASMHEASDTFLKKILPNMHRHLIEISRIQELQGEPSGVFSTPCLVEKKVALVVSALAEVRVWTQFMKNKCDELLQLHRTIVENVQTLVARGAPSRTSACPQEEDNVEAEHSMHGLVDKMFLAPVLRHAPLKVLSSRASQSPTCPGALEPIEEWTEAGALHATLEKLCHVDGILGACVELWAATDVGVAELSGKADLDQEIRRLAEFALLENVWFEARISDYNRLWSCMKKLSKHYPKGSERAPKQ